MAKENIEIKEEGKVKTWMKKHKTKLAVGSTALVGIGFSVVTYKLGYRDGRSVGYLDGVDFCEGELELLRQNVKL